MAGPWIRSILVATDLTERTDPVLRAGAALAEATGADVHLLHAFDLNRPPYMESVEPASFRARVEDARHALQAQVTRALPTGVGVTSSEVVIYVAHKAIEARAEEVSADLIVLGPHRSRRIADAFLGATADRVVRTAEVPTLVVRDDFSLPIRDILVPVDLSQPAQDALDEGARWAAAFGAPDPESGLRDLRVLHVTPLTEGSEDSDRLAPAVEEDVRYMASNALERTQTADSLRAVPEMVRGEEPAEEIIRYAEEARAGLVVMGTHGHGALKRALVGSVTSTVTRRCARPVLLVPPTPWRRGSRG
ncbi:MAG: universal stress protein [Myxococcota bacterium]